MSSLSQCFYKTILKSLLCLQHEDIAASRYTRLQKLVWKLNFVRGFLNLDHENNYLGVHELLKDAVSINNMVQRVDQHLADFLSVQF